MPKHKKQRIPTAWHDMRPGDINPQRVTPERLEAMIKAAADIGIYFKRAPQFDYDGVLFVEMLYAY